MKKSMKKVLSVVTALTMAAGLGFALPAAAEGEVSITPYAGYSFFNFENSELVKGTNFSTWQSGVAEPEVTVEIVKDGAYNGVGALHVNSQGGKCSVWGASDGMPGNAPVAGDKVAGYFYFKLLNKNEGADNILPQVRVYASRLNEATTDNPNDKVEVEFAKTKPGIKLEDVGATVGGDWVRVELESTGNLVQAGDVLNYNITIGGGGVGQEFLIDDVVCGSVMEEMGTDIPSFTPINLTDSLDFENKDLFAANNYYESNEEVVDFKIGDTEYPAASGEGAVYIDTGLGGFSFWSGNIFNDLPKDAKIIGSFKFKLMQPLDSSGLDTNRLPKITITKKENGGNPVVAEFDASAASAKIIPYRWCELPIESTGVTVNPGDELSYSIVNGNGSIKFMLDDVQIGYVESEETAEDIQMSQLAAEEPADNVFSVGFVTDEPFYISDYKDIVFEFSKVNDGDSTTKYYPVSNLVDITVEAPVLFGIQLKDIPAEYYSSDIGINVYLTNTLPDDQQKQSID